MDDIVVTCDRCGQEIDGLIDRNDSGEVTGTAGFYDVTGTWSPYANEGERIICDSCMHEDDRYLADYPHMRQKVD